MGIRPITYCAFLLCLVLTVLVRSSAQLFIGCGSITLFMGFLSAIMVSNWIAEQRRNDAVWHQRSTTRRSMEPLTALEQFAGSSAVSDIASWKTVVKEVSSHASNTIPDWLQDGAARSEWAKANSLGVVAQYFASHPGSVTDDYVRRSIVQIEGMSRDDWYDALDLLDTQIINGHRDGMMADVRKELDESMHRCLYGPAGVPEIEAGDE